VDDLTKRYGSWALVTGSTSGIGEAFAQQLAKQGFNLVLISRDQNKLDKTKININEQHDVQIRTLAIDLFQLDAIDKIKQQTSDLEIGLVIPNAGTENTGELVDNDLLAETRLIHLNMTLPMQMSHHFGQKMKLQKQGGIIFVSSLFGYQPVPFVANYSASKAYILSLAQALHVEMKQYGVDVAVLSPGLTKTTMSSSMPIDFNKLPLLSQQPQQVARLGLSILGSKASVVSGMFNKILAWENRFMPSLFSAKLMGFLISRGMKAFIHNNASEVQKINRNSSIKINRN